MQITDDDIYFRELLYGDGTGTPKGLLTFRDPPRFAQSDIKTWFLKLCQQKRLLRLNRRERNK